MNVKRYIGADIAECMAQVREELGVEAFILNQRTIRKKGIKGLFQKPLVEVVAAYEPNEGKTPRSSPQGAGVGAGSAPRPAPKYMLSDPPFPQPEPIKPASPRPAPRDTIRPEDAHAAAMSVLERIAAQNGAPAAQEEPSVVPPAPPSISAYSPQQLRRQVAANAEPLKGSPSPKAGAGLFTEATVPPSPVPPPALEKKESAEDPAFRPAVIPLVRAEPEHKAPPDREIQKITHLENKLDALSTTLGTLVNKMQISKDSVRGGYPAAVEELLLSLMENDVHEEFAHKMAREAAEILHRQTADARDVMEQLIRQTIGEPAPLKIRRFQRTVVMLVGPTGVGKTTTLAKLAAIYQLNHHAKVGVITTDTFRIAAVQQLKTYAEILEIPISVVYSTADIADALRDHEDKDVVLIDTAGKSPNDTTLEAEITELIKNSDCDEVHLVLSATTGFTGLLNIINTYSFLRDYKVLFTKLDETPSWGMVLNTKFLTDKPISYLAAGQTVPDDIEVMTPRKIIDRLLGD